MRLPPESAPHLSRARSLSTVRAGTPLGASAGVLLAVAALGGCHLVDQRTFEGTGLFPNAAELRTADRATSALPPPPLAVIRMGTPGADWQGPLVAAARAAEARRADVAFDLVAPIPTNASLDAQDAAQKTGAADAEAVAAVLQGDGVDAERIHIGSRGDAGEPPREIEVYVR